MSVYHANDILASLMRTNILYVLFLSTFFLANPAFAENQAADFLVEIGRNSLLKGDVPDAIHEFSKALILEPNNVQALNELKKLGLEGGLYSRSATRTTMTADMAENLKGYQQKVESLEKEKSQLQNVVNALAVSANSNKDCFKGGKSCPEAKALITPECPLACVKKKVVSSIDQAIAYEQELSELTKKYWDLKRELGQDLDQQQKINHVMDAYVSVKDEKISQVNDELIQKEIGLLRARKDVLAKSDDMAELQESLSLYQKRLDDKEQLLRQKDAELKELIAQMNSAASVTTSPDETVGCGGDMPTCGK